MKKFMKNVLSGLLVLGIAAFVTGVVLATDSTTTVTNELGQVIQVKTLSDVSTDLAKTNTYQDFSVYATRPGQKGTIVRWYDTSMGISATATNITLQPAVVIPKGAIINNGFVHTLQEFGSVEVTNSIQLNVGSDILAASTNFATTGISAVIPVGTAGTAVQATADRYLILKHTGAITKGKLMIVLDYTQGIY